MTISDIVGRSRELEIALAVISCGRHLLLEGPVEWARPPSPLPSASTWDAPPSASTVTKRYTENKLTVGSILPSC